MALRPKPNPVRGRPKGSTSFDASVAKDFGTAVVAMRRKGGISQERLAHAADLERSYFGRIEAGAESTYPERPFEDRGGARVQRGRPSRASGTGLASPFTFVPLRKGPGPILTNRSLRARPSLGNRPRPRLDEPFHGLLLARIGHQFLTQLLRTDPAGDHCRIDRAALLVGLETV